MYGGQFVVFPVTSDPRGDELEGGPQRRFMNASRRALITFLLVTSSLTGIRLASADAAGGRSRLPTDTLEVLTQAAEHTIHFPLALADASPLPAPDPIPTATEHPSEPTPLPTPPPTSPTLTPPPPADADTPGVFGVTSSYVMLRLGLEADAVERRFHAGFGQTAFVRAQPVAGDFDGDGVDTVGLYGGDALAFVLFSSHAPDSAVRAGGGD